MIYATSTYVALALAAAAAGGQYYNSEHTAARQDEQAAASIRNQSILQRKADADVNQTVQKLQGSTSEDARTKQLDNYMNVLRANKAKSDSGLTPNIGSNAFQADSANAAQGSTDYASKTAGLMARMDAPTIQRQNEGFDYGNLATDLSMVGRQSQGQSFLDQLKLNAIRRNAKIDLASGLMMAGAGAAGGGASTAMSKAASGGAGYGINGAGNASMYAGYA